jgi:hypothetical protein
MIGGGCTAPAFHIRKVKQFFMFNGKRKREKLMEAISMIKPTSKSALKQQCLYLSHLDVDKAEKMYNFLVKGMDDIPSLEAEQKPFIKNMGEQVSGLMAWLRENQDMLSQGVDFIKGIISSRKGVTTPTAPLPPING